MRNSTSDLPRSVTWASWLVVSLGALVAANWVVAIIGNAGATGADLSFAILLLLTTAASGRGLQRRARWAWLASFLLAVCGLFFVAPIAGTILLGGGTDPVGTGWDVVFFPFLAGILTSLLVLLRSVWKEMESKP
jgi:hypothetical protein